MAASAFHSDGAGVAEEGGQDGVRTRERCWCAGGCTAACTSAWEKTHASLGCGGMVGLARRSSPAVDLLLQQRLGAVWADGSGGGVPLAMKAEHRWSSDSAWLLGRGRSVGVGR